MMEQMVSWLVQTVGQMGYAGIIGLMFLESSFFPFPSEVVIPPAAFLAARGELFLPGVILCGIAGSFLGALFNYWLALKWGRPFFEKYGRFFLVSSRTLDRADRFFQLHGHISTFVGRLLPGIRQYISLPAGVARMDIWLFSLFTALGSGIWVVVLAMIGYFVGNNQEFVKSNIHALTLWTAGGAAVLVLLYIGWYKRRSSRGFGKGVK